MHVCTATDVQRIVEEVHPARFQHWEFFTGITSQEFDSTKCFNTFQMRENPVNFSGLNW